MIDGPFGPIQLPSQMASDYKMKAFKEHVFASSITIPDEIGGTFRLTQVHEIKVRLCHFIFGNYKNTVSFIYHALSFVCLFCRLKLTASVWMAPT